MACENIWQDGVLIRHFSGSITADEVLRENLRLHGDERFLRLSAVINDFSQITGFSVNEKELRTIVSVDNAAELSNPSLKIALVTDNEELLVFIRIYCEMMKDSNYQCRIFSTFDEAQGWVEQADK